MASVIALPLNPPNSYGVAFCAAERSPQALLTQYPDARYRWTAAQIGRLVLRTLQEPPDEKTATRDGPRTKSSFFPCIKILRATQSERSPKKANFEFCGARQIFEFSGATRSS